MELDPKLLISQGHRAAAISLFGIAIPFALGVAISRTLFDTLQGDDPKFKNVNFTAFFVFIGTAMSITAFPVLARFLKESGLIYTKCGAIVMGAAAIDDAVAWCLLILAIAIANAGNLRTAAWAFLSTLALALGLVFLIRPVFWIFVKYIESFNSHDFENFLFAFTICLVYVCAFITSILGVHYIFGGFMFGLIIPRDSRLFKVCNDRIEELVLAIFLPLYFTLSGLQTDISQIKTTNQGLMILLVITIASAGKFIGAGLPAYYFGMKRGSAVIAILMNTRGLVELIVLNLGLSAGILNTKTFSVMVIMCLFTTFITCPLVEIIYPPHKRKRFAAVKIGDDDLDVALGAKGIENALLLEDEHSTNQFLISYPDAAKFTRVRNNNVTYAHHFLL